MGLSIHYNISAKTKSKNKTKELVEKMRQICMDLPFEEVSDLIELEGEMCDFQVNKENDSWLLIGASEHVDLPWTVGEFKYGRSKFRCGCSRTIAPEYLVAFEVFPGDGCEPLNIGLAFYPSHFYDTYRPEQDFKFKSCDKHRGIYFDQWKWTKFLIGRGIDVGVNPSLENTELYHEQRKVNTRIGSKTMWKTACKTQYASDPECGGAPNFLKCHITSVNALERFAEIPGVEVYIDDEGDYGTHSACPDWKEADAEGRDRVYKDFPGNYNPSKLVKELGEWNEMIAGMFNTIQESCSGSGASIESPITKFENFEQLEHFGVMKQDDERREEFMTVMSGLADHIRATSDTQE